jgi:hypothetical protein
MGVVLGSQHSRDLFNLFTTILCHIHWLLTVNSPVIPGIRPQYLDLALHRGAAVPELLRSSSCPPPLQREPVVVMPGSVQTEARYPSGTRLKIARAGWWFPKIVIIGFDPYSLLLLLIYIYKIITIIFIVIVIYYYCCYYNVSIFMIFKHETSGCNIETWWFTFETWWFNMTHADWISKYMGQFHDIS